MMSKPLATMKLESSRFDWLYEFSDGVYLCRNGLRRLFDFPLEARTVWLSAFPRKSNNRIEARQKRKPKRVEFLGRMYTDPGTWLFDGRSRLVSDGICAKLDRLAKKHNRTVFYVECEWE